jgi:transcriptional regulator with XRE-family HTH domain
MTNFKIFPLNDIELGFLFYQKRIKKGLTLRNCAKLAKMSIATISNFENGKGLISMTKILKYAKVIDLNLKFCIEE